jgi:hypothetical protein
MSIESSGQNFLARNSVFWKFASDLADRSSLPPLHRSRFLAKRFRFCYLLAASIRGIKASANVG